MAYQGDEALDRLLTKAGKRLRLPDLKTDGVRVFVAGVLAAPPAPDAEAWVKLVVDDPSPALKAQLLALKAEMAADRGDGVEDDPVPCAERLAELRRELKRRGLDGFIVPRGDEHHAESVPLCARRLAWVTGFTGTAGVAVILPEAAALFVDGRYTLQAKDQVDAQLFVIHHLTERPPAEWVGANLRPGEKLGYDPWLHTIEEVTRFRAACEKAGGELVACESNPVDAVWRQRPPAPIAPVTPHDERFAGKSAAEKRTELAGRLAADGIDAAVLTLTDSIAWLLNIRGGDVAYAPLTLAFALLYGDATVSLFIDTRKLGPGLAEHLGDGVRVEELDRFGPALDGLGKAGLRVQADPATAPAWVFDRLRAAGAAIEKAADPCALPKACKNRVELGGVRAAHLRDGAALTRFLAWFDLEAPKGTLTEMAAAERLEAFRKPAFSRLELSHHLRRRTQRRHRSLPGERQDRPGDYAGHPLSIGFRRAVPRRHDGRHPHPLHPRRRRIRAIGRAA